MSFRNLQCLVVVLVLAGPAVGQTIWSHEGKNDPTTEGWTYNPRIDPLADPPPTLGPVGPVGPSESEVASENAWKIVDPGQFTVPSYESARMTPSQVTDFFANGWEYTVRMSAPQAANGLQHSRGFQFITPGDPAQGKVYRVYVTTDASLNQTITVYNLNSQTRPPAISPGFHTYTLKGIPTGDASLFNVSLFIDGSATPAVTNIPGFTKSTPSLSTVLTPTPDVSFASWGSYAGGGVSSTLYVSQASFTILPPSEDGLAGDFNGDEVVDTLDYVVWRMAYGTNDDLNGNGDETGGSAGVVDDADHAYWSANYGNPGSAAGMAVPEPAVAPLIIFVLGLAAARRARRPQHA